MITFYFVRRCKIPWGWILFSAGGRGEYGGAFHFALLLSLSSRCYRRSVAILLLFDFPLYFFCTCFFPYSYSCSSSFSLFSFSSWYHFLFRLASVGGMGYWGGAFHFHVLLSLSSIYSNSSVATQAASLGSVRLLLSVLPLYSLVLCTPPLSPPLSPPPPSLTDS